ncbi:PAS domain S-box protein [Flavobacterium psychroterrae]|uniref:histidine kinase n=1 Tax=Flavobacterium psychroterrae TaxID=2133767 RepID=A0ABS5PAN6_9FLAO|nr:PAS domain-containing sensor histidine kinase [Flavobacterium psychroterrae]MBS7231339.1 PAS domain S-box protein [Flavobacterium psychroterrae]
MENYNRNGHSLTNTLHRLGGGEALYHKMTDEVADYAILLMDVDGTLLNWNKGAQNIKGYTPDEIVGKNFRVFYSSEDRTNHLPEKLLDEAMRKGKVNHEGWRIKKDGSKFWGSVLITALHDSENNIIALSKVTRDLTERRAAEEIQRRHAMELQHKNEELKQSEARYHSMIAEIADYAIILLDNSGQILNWNKGAERIKGYSANEIIGKNFSQFYLQEDIDTGLPDRLITKAREDGAATHEGWRVKKDGNVFWGSILITALHDDMDRVIGYSKVTRDLTERKMAEERQERFSSELQYKNDLLTRSEERYHRMIAEVEDYAIILLDSQGNIQNWNKGAQKIKGYSEAEILGKNFSIFYLPDDVENGLPQQLLAEASRHNKAALEGWRIRKDGSRFWGSVVITALHNLQGDVTGFSKVTRDLTHKKEADDQILLQNQQLEEFAYVASHDLQEPLRKIITFSNLLKDNISTGSESLRVLEKITHAAQRMGNLITSVLNYSQMKGDENLFQEVDINEVLHNIESDFELLLRDKNGEIVYGSLPIITAIPIQMHQLFANLINNGLKYNKDEPKITIIAEEESIDGRHYYKFSVSDNGVGFDAKFTERIFKMFHRLNNDKQGTGIGLALCKKIAENHGGYIRVESKPGAGATFVVNLLKNK